MNYQDNRTLSKKLLSITHDKSKYLIIGGAAYRRYTLTKTAKTPMKMGDKIIEDAGAKLWKALIC